MEDVGKSLWWEWLVQMERDMFYGSIDDDDGDDAFDAKRRVETLKKITQTQIRLARFDTDDDLSESSMCHLELDENVAGPGVHVDLDFSKRFFVRKIDEFPRLVQQALRVVPLSYTDHVVKPYLEKRIGLRRKENKPFRPYRIIQD